MDADTVTATVSAFDALGINGVSIGLFISNVVTGGVLGLIGWRWVKTEDKRDRAALAASEATSTALKEFSVQAADETRVIAEMGAAINTAVVRQGEMVTAMHAIATRVAELCGRLSK